MKIDMSCSYGKELDHIEVYLDQAAGHPTGWVAVTYIEKQPFPMSNAKVVTEHDGLAVGPSTEDDGVDSVDDLPNESEIVEYLEGQFNVPVKVK